MCIRNVFDIKNTKDTKKNITFSSTFDHYPTNNEQICVC
jgi:hypothetical protein